MEIQWALVLFTLLTSMGGCLFLFVAINEFASADTNAGTNTTAADNFKLGLIALIIAIVGGFCSVPHLAHPDRIMNALSRPASGIFIEAALIGCLAVCIIIYLICLKREAKGGVKVFAVLGAFFGIALSFMAGHSYMMIAVSAWNTWLLPLGYLLTALPMGSSLFWALACTEQKSGSKAAKVTAILGAIALVGVIAYAAVAGAFTGAAMVFAVLSLALSGIAPLAIGIAGTKKPTPALAWTSFCCATAGALFFRVLMWTAYATSFGFFGTIV